VKKEGNKKEFPSLIKRGEGRFRILGLEFLYYVPLCNRSSAKYLRERKNGYKKIQRCCMSDVAEKRNEKQGRERREGILFLQSRM
jgi:hypothetical protein